MLNASSRGNATSAGSSCGNQDHYSPQRELRSHLNTAAAMASLCGDVVIIVTFLCSRSSARSVTLRLVAFFAMANFIGQLPLLPIPAMSPDGDSLWCSVQAAMVWYGAVSSWLWTTAYAHAIQRHFNPSRGWDRPLHAEGGEWRLHAVCWGVPALAVAVGLASDKYGYLYDLPNCSFTDSSWSSGYEIILWCALAYSCFAFVSVQRRIHDVLAVGLALLEEGTRHELRRRMRLWPRFTVYMLTFVLSQAPCAVRSLLQVFCVRTSSWDPWLTPIADALQPLNGFLNAVAFGTLNRALYRHWICACGATGGGAPSPSPSPRTSRLASHDAELRGSALAQERAAAAHGAYAQPACLPAADAFPLEAPPPDAHTTDSKPACAASLAGDGVEGGPSGSTPCASSTDTADTSARPSSSGRSGSPASTREGDSAHGGRAFPALLALAQGGGGEQEQERAHMGVPASVEHARTEGR